MRGAGLLYAHRPEGKIGVSNAKGAPALRAEMASLRPEGPSRLAPADGDVRDNVAAAAVRTLHK